MISTSCKNIDHLLAEYLYRLWWGEPLPREGVDTFENIPLGARTRWQRVAAAISETSSEKMRMVIAEAIYKTSDRQICEAHGAQASAGPWDLVCSIDHELRDIYLTQAEAVQAVLTPPGGPITEIERPTVIHDYGDYVALQCACGAEVGFSPPADDRERTCVCGRVLWLDQRVEYGYRTPKDANR